MKKLFAGIFATVLGLGCLTACGEDNKQVVYNVDAAADFLDATYVDQIVDGRVDYDLLNAITYSGATYTVEWSVDVTEGVVLVNNGNETRVDVDEAAAADMDYVLTATVKDPNGATATVKFYATLLKAPSLVPFAITEKPVEDTAYKLYVYNSFGKFDMYFNGQIASKFYLGSVEDYEQSVDVYVEYVEGSDTLFNLYFNDDTAGKQYFGIKQNWNSTNNYWSYNPYIEAAPVSQFEYSADFGTIITTVPASSVDKQDAPIDTTKVIYWGNASTSSKTYSTIGGIETSDWGTDKQGLPAALVTLGSPAGVSAEEKFAFEKEAISFADSFVGANTVSVGLVGKRYYDVKIAWEVVEGDCITFDDGIFTITNPAAETSVTVKATITLGELTETLTFTATVKPAVVVPEANSTLTIPEANELGNKFEKDKYTEGKYYVTGKIKSISNTQYGNLYIEDEAGNELYIYGLNDEYGNKFEAMDPQPKVGDTITAYGQIGKYNSAQMKNAQMTAYTPGEGGDVGGDEPVEDPTADTVLTIPDALALGASKDHNTYTAGKYYVIGEIQEVYNTEYGNMKIVDADGNVLTVYGTYSADGETRYDALETKPVAGDTVKVYGIIGQYNGTAQMKNGWIVEHTPAEGGEDVGGGETPDPTPDPEPEVPAIKTLTIAEALALGATKEHNTYTEEKYYVEGIITEIYNTTYGNMYIVDEEGNSLTVYGLNIDGAKYGEATGTKPVVGQKIKVLSVVGCFSGTPQLKSADLVEILTVADSSKVAIEKNEVTLSNSATGAATIALASAGSLFSDVAITWEITAGADIASIVEGNLEITNPTAETTVTVKATITCGESIDSKTFDIVVTPAVAGEVIDLATFEFGANGSASHVDGSDLGSSKSYSEGGYTLALTGISKVYGPAYDAKGNSCIKLGTSKVVGSFSFTVPENVSKVVIYVAGYKAATSTNIKINGTQHSVTTASNNGEYTAIEIDTSSTKTIEFVTVTYRCMINKITFVGTAA